jgi:hypothetical protein
MSTSIVGVVGGTVVEVVVDGVVVVVLVVGGTVVLVVEGGTVVTVVVVGGPVVVVDVVVLVDVGGAEVLVVVEVVVVVDGGTSSDALHTIQCETSLPSGDGYSTPATGNSTTVRSVPALITNPTQAAPHSGKIGFNTTPASVS